MTGTGPVRLGRDGRHVQRAQGAQGPEARRLQRPGLVQAPAGHAWPTSGPARCPTRRASRPKARRRCRRRPSRRKTSKCRSASPAATPATERQLTDPTQRTLHATHQDARCCAAGAGRSPASAHGPRRRSPRQEGRPGRRRSRRPGASPATRRPPRARSRSRMTDTMRFTPDRIEVRAGRDGALRASATTARCCTSSCSARRRSSTSTPR